MQEIRFALRALRRAPMFTIVALSTIALGIGVNVVMFSITNAVLLRSLPYPDADRLLWLTGAIQSRGLTALNFSYTRLAYLQDQSRTLAGFGAFAPSAVSLRTSEDPELVPSAIATANLFEVLGVPLAAGRSFRPQEDQPGGADVAIVTNAFWRSHLGGRADVIGSVLVMDGRSRAIVGVLPAGFRFPFAQPEPQIWVPRVFEHPVFPIDRIRSGAAYLNVIARVKPTESLTNARAELAARGGAYNSAFPGYTDASGYVVDAAPLRDALVGPVRAPLMVLFAAAGFVLLIACVNVASLLITRASSRQREIAIRRALGASNQHLLRSMLTESLLLALAGGSVAVLVAANAPALSRILPAGVLPRVDEVAMNSTVVAFSLGLSLLSALVFGIAAARRTTEKQTYDTLKETSRGSTAVRSGLGRAALVIIEIAVACVLVSATALLLRSLNNLTAVDPGFDSHHVVSFTVALPAKRYPDVARQTRFFKQLVDNLSTTPLVESAAANTYLPIGGGMRMVFVCPQGTACQGVGKDPVAAVRHITPAYFATMRIRLVRGRSFDTHDDATSQNVCIINETAASLFFPGQDPIGKTIIQSRGNISTLVVGVARPVKALGLNGQLVSEFYVPQEQSPVPVPSTAIVIRSADALPSLLSRVRSTLSKLDPNLPLSDVGTMDEVIATSVAQPRLTTTLTEFFAALALVLAAIGIYGLIAYGVTQRHQEIAVRMAMGAAPTDILALIFRQGAALVATGLGLGLAGSFAFGEMLRTILFEIGPRDPATLIGVTAVIVLVCMAACYVPARRAMRVDPVAGLRGE